MAVLRVSGLDRGQQGPVGFAGVEQATHSVMSKVDEAELDALDPFREVVDAPQSARSRRAIGATP